MNHSCGGDESRLQVQQSPSAHSALAFPAASYWPFVGQAATYPVSVGIIVK